MPENYTEIGTSGLKKSFGQVQEEYLRELQGEKATKIYKEMSTNDSTVGASLLAIELIIRQIPWRIEAAGEETEYQQDAKFVSECWGDMSQTPENTISEILTMNPFGWSYFELVYKLRQGRDKGSNFDDGRIGWKKWALRSQDTLWKSDFDPTGGIQAMIQRDPETYRDFIIPIDKALLFRTSTCKNNPEGKSLLRNAYRAWYFKKNIENIEAIGTERDLVGLPMAKVPAEIMAADASSNEKTIYQNIQNMLTKIKVDECAWICLPSDTDEKGNPRYDFKLVSSGGSKSFDTDKIIARKAREIAMTVLADFLFLGHEKVGSFALSTDKTDLFTTAIKAWVDQIAGVMNQYAVPRLMELNAIKRDKYPKFAYGDIKAIDLDSLGRFIVAMTQSGMPLFPDPKLEEYIRKLAKLPMNEVK